MLPEWVLPSVLTAFAVVIWFLAKRTWERQESMEKGLHDRLDRIADYLRDELRAMDVRVSVVETLVLPGGKASGGRRSTDLPIAKGD